jgi:hypothetical protein
VLAALPNAWERFYFERDRHHGSYRARGLGSISASQTPGDTVMDTQALSELSDHDLEAVSGGIIPVDGESTDDRHKGEIQRLR